MNIIWNRKKIHIIDLMERREGDFMQIGGRHILLFVTVLSFIAFVGLVIWKVAFDGNVADEVLWIIGVLEIILVMIHVLLRRKSDD